MFAIELLIAFVAPAILFVKVFEILFPVLKSVDAFVKQGTWVDSLGFISLMVVLGILLANIGDFFLYLVNKKVDFVTKTEDSFFEEFGSAHLSVFDMPGFIRSLTSDQFKELCSKSDKEKDEFWDSVFESVVKKAKEDTRRRLDQGKTLIPQMIAHGASEYRKELRAYASETESMLTFCKAVLSTIVFTGFSCFLNCDGFLNIVLCLSGTFLLTYLWTRITIGVYGMLVAKQLTVFIGLSYRDKLSQG